MIFLKENSITKLVGEILTLHNMNPRYRMKQFSFNFIMDNLQICFFLINNIVKIFLSGCGEGRIRLLTKMKRENKNYKRQQ